MGTKVGIVMGLAVGYVLGTRAGREQYERIASAASRLRRTSFVAGPLDHAGQRVSDAVRVQGEKVTDKVADVVKERLFGNTGSQRGEYVDVEVEFEDSANPADPWGSGDKY